MTRTRKTTRTYRGIKLDIERDLGRYWVFVNYPDPAPSRLTMLADSPKLDWCLKECCKAIDQYLAEKVS